MDNYGASAGFNDLWQWKERDSTHGDILNVTDTDEPAYIIAVGTISADKLYVKSHGNYTQSFQMKIGSAKMQFTLKRPEDTVYAADFDKTPLQSGKGSRHRENWNAPAAIPHY